MYYKSKTEFSDKRDEIDEGDERILHDNEMSNTMQNLP